MPRVVRFHKFGGPEVLKLETLDVRAPGEDEVRIKVQALGLNRAEIVFREGKYLERDVDFPSQIGYEASGIVEAIGSIVSSCKVGDKVSTIPSFSMAKYGVYGDTAIVPASAVAHYPENLSIFEATAIWMQYLTAYGALIEFGQTKTADHVLITAASSSVGFAAIQTVKEIGATSIATTRSAAKKQALLDAGADHVIVTDEEDLERRRFPRHSPLASWPDRPVGDGGRVGIWNEYAAAIGSSSTSRGVHAARRRTTSPVIPA